MLRKNLSRFLIAFFAIVTAALLSVCAWAQDSESVLYSFSAGSDGDNPSAGLIFDGAGNLYGTTFTGGMTASCPHGCGTVFELSPTSTGWTETILHKFTNGSDGGYPASRLFLDAAGNLYGTTVAGGIVGNCIGNGSGNGCGVVFKLSPTSSGWKETVLHHFTGGSDGGYPFAGVIADAAGNLYGTTYLGGNTSCTEGGCGVAYELSQSSGVWKETVLHSFNARQSGGTNSYGSLVFDSAGNLYGTAQLGGGLNNGVVFQLVHTSTGWTENVVHAFAGSDGSEPAGSLVFDSAGNMYGTTTTGGHPSNGVVFKISPSGSGWTYSVIHTFLGRADGRDPGKDLLMDAAGNLYGTTVFTPDTTLSGTVFKVSQSAGKWTETVLYRFNGLTDGGEPNSGLATDHAGNLYGVTFGGGQPSVNAGVVFELSPGTGESVQ
jgi:uncharacterized repeat protein (TIGR03803 family)